MRNKSKSFNIHQGQIVSDKHRLNVRLLPAPPDIDKKDFGKNTLLEPLQVKHYQTTQNHL